MEDIEVKKNNVSTEMFIQAGETAKHILGDLPSLPAGLSDKQHVFLVTYFLEVTNIPVALKAARVTLRTYKSWLKNDSRFTEALEDVNFLMKSAIHSTILKDVLYKRDTKLLLKILESFFPETYGPNPEKKEENAAEIVNDMIESLNE